MHWFVHESASMGIVLKPGISSSMLTSMSESSNVSSGDEKEGATRFGGESDADDDDEDEEDVAEEGEVDDAKMYSEDGRSPPVGEPPLPPTDMSDSSWLA